MHSVQPDYQEHLRDSATVAFAFTSGLDFVDYEFAHTLRDAGVAHVLLRDRDESWYQNGVRGLGAIDDVVAYMRKLCQCYVRSMALGLSVGSYGALMFGQLTPVDEVLAMSPVTGVGKDVHPDFDEKWHFKVFHDPSKPPIRDLKSLFWGGCKPVVRAYVGDGPSTELDYGMAARLGVGDISIIPGAGHADVARAMRDSGLLKRLILGTVWV